MIVAPSLAAVSPSIAPEATAFAEEQGVAAYLPAVLLLTQRIFPGSKIGVYVEADCEAANDRTLIVEVDAGALDAEQLIDARRQWVSDIFQDCPTAYVCLFNLRTL